MTSDLTKLGSIAALATALTAATPSRRHGRGHTNQESSVVKRSLRTEATATFRCELERCG